VPVNPCGGCAICLHVCLCVCVSVWGGGAEGRNEELTVLDWRSMRRGAGSVCVCVSLCEGGAIYVGVSMFLCLGGAEGRDEELTVLATEIYEERCSGIGRGDASSDWSGAQVSLRCTHQTSLCSYRTDRSIQHRSHHSTQESTLAQHPGKHTSTAPSTGPHTAASTAASTAPSTAQLLGRYSIMGLLCGLCVRLQSRALACAPSGSIWKWTW